MLTTDVVGTGEKFRHAGFSGSRVDKIIAGELYCGSGSVRSPELHIDDFSCRP